jgi:hypothetical protein
VCTIQAKLVYHAGTLLTAPQSCYWRNNQMVVFELHRHCRFSCPSPQLKHCALYFRTWSLQAGSEISGKCAEEQERG